MSREISTFVWIGLLAHIAAGCGTTENTPHKIALGQSEHTGAVADGGRSGDGSTDAFTESHDAAAADGDPSDDRVSDAGEIVGLEECIANATSGPGQWTGDSVVLLEVAVGTSMDDAVAIVESNGHSIVERLEAIHYLTIDVHDPGVVFEWTCRYVLDTSYRSAFKGAWANFAVGLN